MKSGEWGFVTLMDKCCCLQAGLVVTGVALLYTWFSHLSVCLSAPSLHTFSPCATLCHACSLIKQWKGPLWEVSKVGERNVFHPWVLCKRIREPAVLPDTFRELAVYLHCTSLLTSLTALGQWLYGPKNWGSQLLLDATSHPRALVFFMSIYYSVDLQFYGLLYLSSQQLDLEQTVKHSCRLVSRSFGFCCTDCCLTT